MIFKETKILISILILTFLAILNAYSQETFVVGQIRSITDKQPLPNVSILLKNTKDVTRSNDEGYFVLRSKSNCNTLVFSFLGYKTKEIKIKPGKSESMNVEMLELNTDLDEVLIFPDANLGWEWIKKIRKARIKNDLSLNAVFEELIKEENLVLLNKINKKNTNNRLFDQLKSNSLNINDSNVTIPLLKSENTWQKTRLKKTLVNQHNFISDKLTESVILKLFGEIDANTNFYNHSVSIMGKNFISPLANIGKLYYNYLLLDSLQTEKGKEYIMRFKPINKKDLAFIGTFNFDSTTLALTSVKAELSARANINFISHLSIEQKMKQNEQGVWATQNQDITIQMNYQLTSDSTHNIPEILVKQHSTFTQQDSITTEKENFAHSQYNSDSIDRKLNDMSSTPVFRAARWIVSTLFTGYMPAGKIDIGKVQYLARLTDIEGFRLNAPLYTNEKLWKNVTLGGQLGYAFKSKEVLYTAEGNIKLPFKNRTVLGIRYTQDYRSINYDYDNFIYYENPLVCGDENIANTIFGIRTGSRINKRDEFSISLAHDWTNDFETCIIGRLHNIFSNQFLPLSNITNTFNSIEVKSLTVFNRWSFDEKTYDKSLRRVYIPNYSPVFYAFGQIGQYKIGSANGKYLKLFAGVHQRLRFNVGLFEYLLQGTYLSGSMPYPLLLIPPGSDVGGYSYYGFNNMLQMEFIADKYMSFHSELTLNGLLLNRIPIIRNFNLRELISFHGMYGSLGNQHRGIIEMPVFTQALSKPYGEVGVGITNILKIITLQSYWRLTHITRPGAFKWQVVASFNISL